ncbi:MAG: hypothetical protein H3C27_15465 [Opitutaceae bacterium]|nr:hypothetical protein [Opitutaceae bacterium]
MSAELEILIKIREEIAALNKAREGLAGARTQAAGLNKELDKSTELSRKLSGTFGQFTAANLAANAITFLTRSLSQAVARMFALGQEITNQSRNLGLSIQGYQVLRKTIQDTGGSLEALRSALTTHDKALVNARTGVGQAASAYRRLGLSIDELANMGRERQLEAIAGAIARASDKQAAWSAASKLLGTDTVPQLRGAIDALATQGYDKLTTSMIRNGQIMNDVTVERLNKAKQAWSDFFRVVTVQSAELGSALFGGQGGMALWLAQFRDPALVAALNAPPTPPPANTEEAELIAALSRANHAVETARMERELREGNPMQSDSGKRQAVIKDINAELRARKELFALTRKQGQLETETAEDYNMRLLQQNAELDRLAQRLWSLTYPRRAHSRISDRYHGINDPQQNPDYLANGREAVEAGMMNFMISMGSMGQQTAAILEQTLGASLNSISDSVWGLMKGTQNWGQAWRNLGDIAGRMLTEMIVRMTIVRSLTSVFGWALGGATGANAGAAVAGNATLSAAYEAAGGGTFLTNGPTHFTVGDNPGGVELVQVTPISGIGQTKINGRGLAMAGGGTALVNGSSMGTTAPITVHQVIQVSTGVQDTVRAELMGMLPQLKAASVDAVQEAQARGRLHI